VPPCQAYDPAFAYELGTIVREGLHRMYGPPQMGVDPDVFYYVTLYNENYPMPARPDVPDLTTGIMQGLYRWRAAPDGHPHQATILFSGTAHTAARQAADELAEHYGVAVELWSATSYKALREEALAVERWNRLHPAAERRTPLVTRLLADAPGPIVAVTDFMTLVPDQVSRFLSGKQFVPLGTDGMGRSDTREALRRFFEVDAAHTVVATLAALAQTGSVGADIVTDAIARYGIDPDAVDPFLV
jgi:pyruvate dehydrogenase E1 component